MILRLGFLVAASIAAYAVQQIAVKTQNKNEEEDKQDITCSTNSLKEDEEEEKEEVKLINSIIDPSPTAPSDFQDGLLPGFDSIDFPLPTTDKYKQDRIYEHEMSHNASEFERLRNLVGELLEYYGLKEQESRRRRNKCFQT